MSGIGIQGETEQSIVSALRQGQQEMLGKLYDAYAPVMMGVISSIVQDNEVAEEVLRETFIAIWSRIGVYDASKQRLLTWGLAIARGIALEAVKTDRYNISNRTAQNLTTSKATENKNVDIKQEKFKNQDICKLTPLERNLLELLYLKGRTCAEAAGELNMTVEEAKAVLRKAFIHLKAAKSV